MLGAFEIEFHQILILAWLLLGGAALWIAQKLHLSRAKTVNILLPLAIGLAIFTFYVSTRFNYDFLIDDVDIIAENPDVTRADGWKTLWTNDYWTGRSSDQNLYRPVTILSYWINARLPKCAVIVNGEATSIAPRYFRGVNMILLLGLCWLLAMWLMRYVQQAAAWTVAFLFAAHPAHGEMVNYVVCRADLLAMIGTIGFLLMHRLSLEQGRWRWWQALLALAAAIVAFGSKESGLILIPAAIAQMWVGPRHASTDILEDIPPIGPRVHAGTLALLLLPAAAYFAMRMNVVGAGVDYAPSFVDDMRDNPLRMVPLADRIPAAISIAWFYTRQIISPDISYYHIPATLPGWTSGSTIMGITVFACVGILGASLIRRRSWLIIALVLAGGQYLLIGNLLMPVGVYAANRLILPFTLAAAMLLAGVLHAKCGHSTRSRAVVLIPAGILMIFMGITLLQVNHNWGTESRLLGADFRMEPENPVDQYNFGTVRARDGRRAQEYVQALQTVNMMLAKIQKEPVPTQELLDEMRPISSRLHKYMETSVKSEEHRMQIQALRNALVLADRVLKGSQGEVVTPGDIDQASKQVQQDMKLYDDAAKRYWAESRALLAGAVAQRPRSRSAALELGKVHEYLGEYAKAREQYERVVMIAQESGDPPAHRDTKVIEARILFAWMCIQLRQDGEKASKTLKAAEENLAAMLKEEKTLPPPFVEELHYFNRSALRYHAMVYVMAGHIGEAQKRYKELLLRYPDFKEAWEDLPQIHQPIDPTGDPAASDAKSDTAVLRSPGKS